MLKSLSIFIVALFMATAVNGATPRRQLIDDNWQFKLLSPDSTAGNADAWTNVDLPHDWSITRDFKADYPSGNDGGYVVTGRGLYRKNLNIPAADAGKRHYLYLEGAYMDAKVTVNGDSVGRRPYGYSSVIYEITPQLHPGDNLIEVDVDNSRQKNCRWFSGSGIYRHVWLLTTPEVNIKPWSLYVTTPKVSAASANANVTFDIDNASDKACTITPSITITDSEGKVVATRTGKPVTASARQVTPCTMELTIDNPALWSPDTPALYNLTVSLAADGNVIDSVDEHFGVRTFEYSADKGLTLNGKPIVLNGGCAHHDNGVLGANSYDAAEARKVSLMKQAGFNAVRTSHNPPSPAFLDECDRQGLIVIDESFDGWRDSKTPYDYSRDIDQWWDKDIESMVLRDRNHPSIFCWSIGNEVIERKRIEVVTTAHKLASLCRKLDPTRPVTSALAAWDSDWEIYDPLAAEHDIVGYNYMIHKAESDHQRVPERVMWQTESYPRDAFANWCKVNDNPYIIGDFVWTALDYLGESGIGRFYYKGESEGEHYHRNQWPWHGAYCGDIDLTGWRKPISHYREMLYNPDKKLYMAVREPDGYYGEIKETQWSTYPTWESWNWPGHEGKQIDVEIVSHYPRVRLYLDDKLIGERNVSRDTGFKAVFPIPYTPGKLRATGIDTNGNEVEEVTLATAGKPAAIRLTPDRTNLSADNQDLAYIVIEVVDKDGNVVPIADNMIEVSVTGNGSLIATGSADLKDTSSYKSPKRKAWKGRAIAVAKSSHNKGTIKVKATSPGLKSHTVTLKSVK